MILLKVMFGMITTYLLYVSVRRFLKGNKNIVFFPLIVLYIFNVIPVLLDVFIGRPEYRSYRIGFINSQDDFCTELIYLIIILYIFFLLFRFQGKYMFFMNFQESFKNNAVKIITFMGYFAMIIIVVVSLLTPYRSAIIQYEMRFVTDSVGSMLKNLGVFLVLISLLILFIEKRRQLFWAKFLSILPFAIFGIMINGKKAVFFIFVAGIILAVLLNNVFEKTSFKVLFIILSLMSTLLFLNFYSSVYGQEQDDFEVEYESFRVEYGRDDTLKTVIYDEINDDNNSILEYRGQTFLFYISTVLFIRREAWPEKPYPYATYFTSYYTGHSSLSLLNYTMTTSIIDEFVSNLGFIGSVILPFILVWFLKVIMKSVSSDGNNLNNRILSQIVILVGIVLTMLLFAVEISAFIYVWIVYILLLLVLRFTNKYRIVFGRLGRR